MCRGRVSPVDPEALQHVFVEVDTEARCARYGDVPVLLDRQAPVDARDAEGKTPLDYAAFVAGWYAYGRDFSFMENSRIEPAR